LFLNIDGLKAMLSTLINIDGLAQQFGLLPNVFCLDVNAMTLRLKQVGAVAAWCARLTSYVVVKLPSQQQRREASPSCKVSIV